ncbi:MAG: alpha-galactosidase [Alphaproteobacteria bacterium]|nr:alpha-galactosidase [Alphaproteobacteria bacterium]
MPTAAVSATLRDEDPIVKRKAFLTAGAAMAGWAGLPGVVRTALAQGAAPSPSRVWLCPPSRFEIAVRGAVLTVDCFDQAAATTALHDGIDDGREALIAVGRQRQPVSWEVDAWRQPDARTLVLELRAAQHPLRAEVHFDFDPASGMLTRRTRVRHDGTDGPVDITATLALSVAIREPIRRMTYLAGGWETETDIQRVRPGEAAIVLESRAGMTGFDFQPHVLLHAAAASYVCQIFWSGNWTLRVARRDGATMLLGGLNNWQFHHRLQPGGSLALPTVLFGRFEGAPGLATRRLHDYRRARRPDPDRVIPVQYNCWYSLRGQPTAEALLPLVPIVARLGCEAFVVDAGWSRTDDGESDAEWDQRTGDWRVSRRRFPYGLREVAARCRQQGLRFGVWFEPEVIAPASSIRRDHPEWLHHIGGKAPAAGARAVLNLGVPAAWQHVFDRVTRILRAVGVDWMKWDFNSEIGAGGWAPGLPEALTEQAVLVAHYEGLYRLFDAIRAAFPDLILETCAGGGGRMDGGILAHAHVNWISDQVGPLRKLAIHFGTQLAHPAVMCNDWLIDWPGDAGGRQVPRVEPRGDLQLRLRVAMLGSFGISAPIEHWSGADLQVAARHVALYKTRLRAIIQHGDQYFLTRPPPPDGNGAWAAVWYAAKDGSTGVLFCFRLAGPEAKRVFRLPGLHAARRYRAAFYSGEVVEASGEMLAAGLAVTIADTFRSALCLVEVMPD